MGNLYIIHLFRKFGNLKRVGRSDKPIIHQWGRFGLRGKFTFSPDGSLLRHEDGVVEFAELFRPLGRFSEPVKALIMRKKIIRWPIFQKRSKRRIVLSPGQSESPLKFSGAASQKAKNEEESSQSMEQELRTTQPLQATKSSGTVHLGSDETGKTTLTMLQELESEGAVVQFAQERGWNLKDGRIYFPTQSDAVAPVSETPGTVEPINAEQRPEKGITLASASVIENAIGYARELETIV